MLPFIRDWAESAAGFSGVEVLRGFSQIPAMRKAAVAATAPFDFVLSPTAPMTAFPAEWPSPSHDPLHPFPHIGFTVAFNMSEQPAASINCGYDSEGLPIGLQIIGRRFDDLGVLAIARAFEAMRAFEDEAVAGAAGGLIGSQCGPRLASLSGRRKARKSRRAPMFLFIFCDRED